MPLSNINICDNYPVFLSYSAAKMYFLFRYCKALALIPTFHSMSLCTVYVHLSQKDRPVVERARDQRSQLTYRNGILPPTATGMELPESSSRCRTRSASASVFPLRSLKKISMLSITACQGYILPKVYNINMLSVGIHRPVHFYREPRKGL